MAVHLTRIYTRTGDAGTTALGDGSRVPKTDPRIEAYADVDETNAAIGMVLALSTVPEPVARSLTVVQNDLFDVGADLATPITAGGASRLRITEAYVTRLEGWCDQFNADLPTLDSFVLPGGTPAAALLHVARTVCRRAERRAWALVEHDPAGTNLLAVTYLNRLADLLFILARVANHTPSPGSSNSTPGGDIRWVPGAAR
jgi:cob(I)alamin adenosyltransferase